MSDIIADISVRKEPLRITVSQGHQIHLLRLYAPAVETRAQLLVVPGLGHDSAVWLTGDGGWVYAMARSGWNVYVADTRGKGRSLPKISPQSDWGLQSLWAEELPALIKSMRTGHEALPWACVAEDVSALAVLACLASRPAHHAGLKGLVLVQAGRPASLQPSWHWYAVQTAGRCLTRMAGYVQAPWLPGPAAESRQRFFESLEWLCAPVWHGEDGVNLDQQIQQCTLPKIFHIAQEPHWLPVSCVQSLMHRLPLHDARLLRCEADDIVAWRQGALDAGSLGLAISDWLNA
ncbi:MAG TPA: hypothetical protein VIM96_05730 [Pseudomonadales bacterium]|jgi:predicted alpha/beta hydrolase